MRRRQNPPHGRKNPVEPGLRWPCLHSLTVAPRSAGPVAWPTLRPHSPAAAGCRRDWAGRMASASSAIKPIGASTQRIRVRPPLAACSAAEHRLHLPSRGCKLSLRRFTDGYQQHGRAGGRSRGQVASRLPGAISYHSYHQPPPSRGWSEAICNSSGLGCTGQASKTINGIHRPSPPANERQTRAGR